jgi:K+-transporting ATPase ATPase C chain
MIRRILLPSILLTVVMAIALGILYPLFVTGVGQVAFASKANGSLVKQDGQVVGSSLLGQEFLDKSGNPDPRYFQPRPSAAGTGYDGLASGATNLGPSDPRLVGFIPGFNTVGLDGNSSATNPFATSADPYCVPTDPKGAPVIKPSPGQTYAKAKDGSYVPYPNTVPERAITYRAFNHLAANVQIPVDAVTASASGLDPGISVANAELQASRLAGARGLSTDVVLGLITKFTQSPNLGFVGEKWVNVVKLNLALDAISK